MRAILFTTLALMCAGCTKMSDPALVQGLTPMEDNAWTTFDTRVAETFPAGTDVLAFTRELQDQGFTLRSSTEALWRKEGFPCQVTARITWEAEDGQITATEGMYFKACL